VPHVLEDGQLIERVLLKLFLDPVLLLHCNQVAKVRPNVHGAELPRPDLLPYAKVVELAEEVVELRDQDTPVSAMTEVLLLRRAVTWKVLIPLSELVVGPHEEMVAR